MRRRPSHCWRHNCICRLTHSLVAAVASARSYTQTKADLEEMGIASVGHRLKIINRRLPCCSRVTHPDRRAPAAPSPFHPYPTTPHPPEHPPPRSWCHAAMWRVAELRNYKRARDITARSNILLEWQEVAATPPGRGAVSADSIRRRLAASPTDLLVCACLRCASQHYWCPTCYPRKFTLTLSTIDIKKGDCIGYNHSQIDVTACFFGSWDWPRTTVGAAVGGRC